MIVRGFLYYFDFFVAGGFFAVGFFGFGVAGSTTGTGSGCDGVGEASPSFCSAAIFSLSVGVYFLLNCTRAMQTTTYNMVAAIAKPSPTHNAHSCEPNVLMSINIAPITNIVAAIMIKYCSFFCAIIKTP